MAANRDMTATKRAPARSRRKPAGDQWQLRGLSDNLPFGTFLPPDQVTAEVAVRVTCILACVRFISQSIACMPVEIMRRRPGEPKSHAVDIPCYDVLTWQPNSWQSQYEYLEVTGYHLALHGNAYSRIVSGPSGFCSSLEPLHPSRMQVMRSSDNSLTYRYLFPDGVFRQFQQSEILHYRWISDNGFVGQVPAELCGTSVALARKLDVAASVFWDNSARPDAVLQTKDTIPDEAVNAFRARWQEIYGGARKRGAMAILPKNTEFVAIQGNSNEASQFMELRKSMLPDIARVYGIPTTLLGDAEMAKFSNVEQEFITAHVFGLLPWQKRIEGAIDRSILRTYSTGGDRVYSRLDSRALLRGDTQARVALHQFLFNTGAITPNEIRDLEDLALMDDECANVTYMQQGFAPLSMVASSVAGGADNASQMAIVLQVVDLVSAGKVDRDGAIALILVGAASTGMTAEAAAAIVDGAMAAMQAAPVAELPPVDPEVFDLEASAEQDLGEESTAAGAEQDSSADDSSMIDDEKLAEEEDAIDGT